jgi:hypothetical protein
MQIGTLPCSSVRWLQKTVSRAVRIGSGPSACNQGLVRFSNKNGGARVGGEGEAGWAKPGSAKWEPVLCRAGRGLAVALSGRLDVDKNKAGRAGWPGCTMRVWATSSVVEEMCEMSGGARRLWLFSSTLYCTVQYVSRLLVCVCVYVL